MKINKYKKLKNGKYEIILDNLEKIELYEDIILKYELLIKKEINNVDIDNIIIDNKMEEAYYSSLKYLQVRIRSKKEIHDNLIKKDYDEDSISFAIEKLEKQGYINDRLFASMYLNNKLITTTNGPRKIRLDLQKNNISDYIIDEVLKDYTFTIQKEKIEKIIKKIVLGNKNKGNVLLKKKILNDLMNEGFNKTLIDDCINDYDFIDDKERAKKEYQKIYYKLSKKYSGSELEYKVKQKMYQKGFINY